MLVVFFVFIGGLAVVLVLHGLFLKSVLRSERAIFLFHLAFFVAFPLLVWAVCGRDQPQPVVLLLALYGSHACFSLGFLELWSLTQGSYSLQMLSHIRRDAGRDLLPKAEAIGRGKFDSRLASLEKLGLVGTLPDRRITLTAAGRVASIVTAMIASIAVTDLRE